MIHILHGEQIEQSRRELTKIREKYKEHEIIILDGKTISLTDLIVATDSGGLFGNSRLVVVENFLSRRLGKKSAENVQIEAILKQLPKDISLVFWEDKELGKNVLNLFPKSTDFALFKPDRSIFAFVESVSPQNAAKSIMLFQKATGEQNVELVFAMLIRQLRLLIMAKDLGKNGLGLPLWQAAKLLKQAQSFTLEQLVNVYKELGEIDYQIKTGQSPLPLKEVLTVWLARL